MKVIWLILLVMVLFNGFLFTFNMFFEDTPDSYSPTNISSNSTFQGYKTPGDAGFSLVTAITNNALGILSVITCFLITLATKNLKYLAAGVMAGVISSLWISTASVFTNILNSNAVIMGIYSLMSIAIGIIVAILILSIFTEQEQLQ